MAVSFAILRDDNLREAVAFRLKDKHGDCTHEWRLPVIESDSGVGVNGVHLVFATISAWIEGVARELGPSSLRGALAFLEVPDPDLDLLVDMNPTEEVNAPYGAVAALLVLAFPEIYWVFYCHLEPPAGLPGFADAHVYCAGRSVDDFVKWRSLGYSPLLDPTGFRRKISHRGSSCDPPSRAAVIDEEPEYAAFNALALYRSGHLVWTATTYRAMRKFFGLAIEGNSPVAPPIDPSISVEDIYLHFADRREVNALSSLATRDSQFPQLADARLRVFVTGGHHNSPASAKVYRENCRYLSGRRHRWVFKPVGGLLSLHRDTSIGQPGVRTPSTVAGDEQIHSTRGRVLMVANCLLRRASALLESSPSVEDALQAAVLGREAKEILAGKTPTTAVEAVGIQHEAELTAECLFNGVEFNFELKDRFREIDREIAEIEKYYEPRRSRRSALNARLGLAERLASVCREFHQVEEEVYCLSQARRLRFRLYRSSGRLRWLLTPLLWYFEKALSSLPAFLALLFSWIVIFGFIYRGVSGCNLITSLAASAYFTFTLSPAPDWNSVQHVQHMSWCLIMAFQGMISFTSLGLLLSHLYMIVSRR